MQFDRNETTNERKRNKRPEQHIAVNEKIVHDRGTHVSVDITSTNTSDTHAEVTQFIHHVKQISMGKVNTATKAFLSVRTMTMKFFKST